MPKSVNPKFDVTDFINFINDPRLQLSTPADIHKFAETLQAEARQMAAKAYLAEYDIKCLAQQHDFVGMYEKEKLRDELMLKSGHFKTAGEYSELLAPHFKVRATCPPPTFAQTPIAKPPFATRGQLIAANIARVLHSSDPLQLPLMAKVAMSFISRVF